MSNREPETPTVRKILFCTRGHPLVVDEAARVWVHQDAAQECTEERG